MRITLKSTAGIFFVVFVFVLSYISWDHIDKSYMLNEPDHVVELEAANDSLETLVEELEEQKETLEESRDKFKQMLHDLDEEETPDEE